MELPTNIVKVDYDGLEALVRPNPKNRNIFGYDHKRGRLAYLCAHYAPAETHFVALSGTLIIGIGSVAPVVWLENTVELSHISIDADFNHHGHARRILSYLFEDLATSGQALKIGRFSAQGKEHLPRLLPELHRRQPHLPIYWTDGLVPTYGHRPYRLGSTRHQDRTVIQL
mgnify:CR=1 FL=1